MRIVLSRKGFDSGSGGRPSPILENGELLSLPIPEANGTVAYEDLRHRGYDVGQMVRDLGPNVSTHCHLDPDVDASAITREIGWRPAFGQSEAAARHLDNNGVNVGDLFLFFGWFRRAQRVSGKWYYTPRAPDLHVLWGWLRVAAIVDPARSPAPAGLALHPHFDGRARPGNRVYVGRNATDGGVFRRLQPSLVLTEGAQLRSRWRLPIDFLPRGRKPLTYHSRPSRWASASDSCTLTTVGRGQEFVLEADAYPEARAWAEGLVASAG
jgi:hypothetical protein